MTGAKNIFHKISYLQYPIVAISLYYYYFFFISLTNHPIEWDQLSNVLLFYGISLSFSSLQDSTKTQNKLSRKIWVSPLKGKIALIVMSVFTIVLILSGLLGSLNAQSGIIKDLSIGFIVLGIGLMGVLKVAIEMFENHRSDKVTSDKSI